MKQSTPRTAFYFELGNCWRVEVMDQRRNLFSEAYRLRVLEYVRQNPDCPQPPVGTEFDCRRVAWAPSAWSLYLQ